jgi:hypothetical protein
MVENEPRDLIESVLLRPQVYTIAGTFEEAVAFLVGYVSGLAKCRPRDPVVIRWNNLELAAAERTGRSITDGISCVRTQFPSGDDALRELQRLYRECLNQDS